MNDQQLDRKVSQDAAKIKNDLEALVKDSTARLSRYEDSLSQATGKATEDLTAQVSEGVAQLSQGLEKLSGDAKDGVVHTTARLKKDVAHQLGRYNAKAQKLVEKLPDGFGRKIASLPWLAITIGLAVGFLLGSFLKPARQAIG